MKNFLAFIVSPFIGVLAVHIVITFFFTSAADGTISTFFRFIQFSLIPYLFISISILIVSIPVFLTIRFFWEWRIWGCFLGAGLVFLIIGIMFSTGENKIEFNEIEYLSSVKMLFAWIFGATVYGVLFWLIVIRKPSKQNK